MYVHIRTDNRVGIQKKQFLYAILKTVELARQEIQPVKTKNLVIILNYFPFHLVKLYTNEFSFLPFGDHNFCYVIDTLKNLKILRVFMLIQYSNIQAPTLLKVNSSMYNLVHSSAKKPLNGFAFLSYLS